MKEQGTVAISCSQCGSPFNFREGDRNALCPACGTLLAISGESGIARFYLDAKLDLLQARSAARKFLATSGVDERVVESLRFEKGELCFLPFWRLRGYAAGWFWAERETVVREEDYDENGAKYVRETRGPNERAMEQVLARVDYSSPACDVGRFGLKGIATVSAVLPLKGMNYEALAKRGTVFDPTKEVDLVRKEAVAQARGRGGGKGVVRMLNRVSLCGENMALISYPVWSLTFGRGERLYPLTVDAVNGRMLKGRFPGTARIRLFQPMATVMLIVFGFSIHSLVGVALSIAFLIWLASSSGLSVERLLSYFFLLVERGEEVEIG